MNHGKRLLLLPILLLLFVVLLSFSFFAFAQSSSNYDVTVSPVFFDLTANPDTNLNGIIKVRNNTSSPIPLKIDVKRLEGDLSGSIALKQETNDTTLSWIKFQNDSITLKPLEWTEIPFSIQIPKNAAYGYYWAISFTQQDKNQNSKTGAVIKGAAAVPILLNVRRPGAKLDGKLISFKSDSGYYEYLPAKLQINFENTGNVHIRPKGNIFIKDWLGNQIATLPINNTQGTILPNSTKILESIWNDGFITNEPKVTNGVPKLDKNGKVQTQLKIRWEKILDFRVGRYTAQALVVLSTDTRDIPFEATTSFFVFSWKIIIAAILLFVFAFVGFFDTFKNIVRRILKLFKIGNDKKLENEN